MSININNKLPFDVIAYTQSFLLVEERVRCESVCKLWQKTAKSSVCWVIKDEGKIYQYNKDIFIKTLKHKLNHLEESANNLQKFILDHKNDKRNYIIKSIAAMAGNIIFHGGIVTLGFGLSDFLPKYVSRALIGYGFLGALTCYYCRDILLNEFNERFYTDQINNKKDYRKSVLEHMNKDTVAQEIRRQKSEVRNIV